MLLDGNRVGASLDAHGKSDLRLELIQVVLKDPNYAFQKGLCIHLIRPELLLVARLISRQFCFRGLKFLTLEV